MTGYDEFDTLCLAWKDQLKIKSFQSPNENDSIDCLFDYLLKDVWIQCENHFKRSQMSEMDMQLATDDFCLHLMSQLVSTQKKWNEIRSERSKEDESFSTDCQITDSINRAADASYLKNASIDSLRCLGNSKQNDIQECEISNNQLIVTPEKNNKDSKPSEEMKKSHFLLYPLSSNDQRSINEEDKTNIEKNKEEHITEKEKIDDEGSAKIEIDGAMLTNYFEHHFTITTRSSPVLLSKPVYTKRITESTLPFLSDCKQKAQWDINSFPHSFSATSLSNSQPRSSILHFVPKKLRPPRLFSLKKDSI